MLTRECRGKAKQYTSTSRFVCRGIFGLVFLRSWSAFRQLVAAVRVQTNTGSFNAIIVLTLSHTNLSPFTSHYHAFVDQPTSILPYGLRTRNYLSARPPVFSSQSRVQLKSAVGACLKLSPKGKCVKGPHGPIGTWDVSRVTDMSRMFARAKFFDNDLSKWDVSKVKDMRGMFLGATSFNGDLSKWDVSSVNDMHGMFLGARLFNRKLCTAAWVNSKARKDSMFEGTSASLSSTVCTMTTIPAIAVFSPHSRAELKMAVDMYLEYLSENHGSDGFAACINSTNPKEQTEKAHEKGQGR